MQLQPTGERVIEEYYLSSPERYLIYLFHTATYRFALEHARGNRVLDYGCGSGYGSHLIAPACQSVTGVDISADAVAYAAEHYQAPNLDYRRIDRAEVARLPFADASFDTVLSFQVIEHIRDVEPYLSEIWRVLKPKGVFICATPDRSTRLLPWQKPWNVYHVHEYGAREFAQTLTTKFANVDMWRMGGNPAVLGKELRRTRRARWACLPFTLPFVPELLRISSLNLLKSLGREAKAAGVGGPEQFGFSEEDLCIGRDITPSVNLIAVARKSTGP
jgi:SAM-dependent methyltransferase